MDANAGGKAIIRLPSILYREEPCVGNENQFWDNMPVNYFPMNVA
jgi:hypothetical protein